MSVYVTDMTKRPVEMLLGLLNNDNNLGLVEADVDIQQLQAAVPPEGKTYNTSVDIDLLSLPSEVTGDFVTFFYTRVDLATLFSEINPQFREVDVPLQENGLPVDNDVLFAEILRKFGVKMEAADFTVALKETGVLTITATATNLAYIGAFDIAVANSLASRVKVVQLDGFEAPVAP